MSFVGWYNIGKILYVVDGVINYTAGGDILPVVNIKSRSTNDKVKFENYKKSSNSLLYVNKDIQCDQSGEDILLIHVGDRYMIGSKHFEIPKKGLIVKPQKSVVLFSEQTIAVPLNMIGIIEGMGHNIFSGGFISCGKIDQGFEGQLKIGYFNSSKQNVRFRQGDILACVIFLETEKTLAAAGPENEYAALPKYNMTSLQEISHFFSENWVALLSILIALIGLMKK